MQEAAVRVIMRQKETDKKVERDGALGSKLVRFVREFLRVRNRLKPQKKKELKIYFKGSVWFGVWCQFIQQRKLQIRLKRRI